MKYLLYCVFRTCGHRIPQPLLGVGGQPVVLLARNGLSAAVSRISRSDLAPDISRLRAYGNVIQSFHRDVTLIPMRYGCLFEEESEVVRRLEERNKEYEELLKELDGCVELGIRILPENGEGGTMNAERSSPCAVLGVPHIPNPGRAYLDDRKAHYARSERLAKENRAVIERCRAAFAGLFVKCKAECPPSALRTSPHRAPLVSMYFLVRRERVESFRRTFRQIDSKESARLLLSGPWPPYNFIESVDSKIVTRLGEQIENE